MSYLANSPRAEASRRNGAKSKGPVTADGKERASKNALKHGLCATSAVLLNDEDETAFEMLDQSLKADLRPSGPLETLLTSRLAIAAWRMSRADRIEADLLGSNNKGQDLTMGEKVTRDRHGPQAIDCLLRYRGSTHSEFWRALAALRAIQSENEENSVGAMSHTKTLPTDVTHQDYIEIQVDEGFTHQKRNEPETR